MGGYRELCGCSTHNQWFVQSLEIVTAFYNYNQKQEDEVGSACRMHGTAEKCIESFGNKFCREETTWKT